MSYTPTGIYSAVTIVNGQPKGEILAEGPGDTVTGVPAHVAAAWIAGKVAICWDSTTMKPIRRLSEETKARRRKTRIAKKYPLFADQFSEEKRDGYA